LYEILKCCMISSVKYVSILLYLSKIVNYFLRKNLNIQRIEKITLNMLIFRNRRTIKKKFIILLVVLLTLRGARFHLFYHNFISHRIMIAPVLVFNKVYCSISRVLPLSHFALRKEALVDNNNDMANIVYV